MIRHILFAFLLCLPLTASLKETHITLNININQTKFTLGDNQIIVRWNKVNGFNGEYRIQYQNYNWPFDSNEWETMTSRHAEVTLKRNLICGSTYRIKISYSFQSTTYFDITKIYVGKSPKALALSLDYSTLTGIIVSWTMTSPKTDYVFQLKSTSSCDYKVYQHAKSQSCSIPNKSLVNYLRGCRKSCSIFQRTANQRITFTDLQPNKRYIVTIFATQEAETAHFCEPIWTYKGSSQITQMEVLALSNSINIEWNRPSNPGGLIQFYYLEITELLDKSCKYGFITCQDCYKMENYTNVAINGFINKKCQTYSETRYDFQSNDKKFKYSFCNLEPDTQYNVSISAINGNPKTSTPVTLPVQTWERITNGDFLLSQGKKTNQSSIYHHDPNLTFPSSLGNDGNLYTTFNTLKGPNNFWMVDLGQLYNINRLYLVNRKDLDGERVRDIVVSYGKELDNLTKCAYYKGPSSTHDEFGLKCKGLGRYVHLRQNINEFFHLNEVQVFGTLPSPPTPTEIKVVSTSRDTISIEWKFGHWICGIRFEIEKTTYFGTEYRSIKSTKYDWKDLSLTGTFSFRIRAIRDKTTNYAGKWSESAVAVLQENNTGNVSQEKNKNDFIESEIRKIKITDAKAWKVTHFLILITSADKRKDYPITKYDVIMATAMLHQVIKQDLIIKKDPILILKIFDNMLNLSSTLFETKALQPKENTIASNLVSLLHEASQRLNSANIYKHKRIAIANYCPKYRGILVKSGDIIVFNPEISDIFSTNSIPKPQRLQIAINISQIMDKKITFTLMDDASFMCAQEKGHKSNIVTSVISANIQQSNINDTMDDISATIDLTPAKKSDSEVVCVSWDPVQVAWSSRGCTTTLVDFNSTTRRCQCSHLSSFALLMKVDCKFSNSSSQERALGVISYLCLILSNLCLAFVIVVYIFFLLQNRQSSSDNHELYNAIQSKSILALCVTLFCANMVLIFSGYFPSQLDSKSSSCKFIGGLLHFGYLSSIIWSFIESASVANSIFRIHSSSSIPDFFVTNYLLKAYILGWGLPAFIVALTAGIYRGENYGYDVCAGVVDNTADNIKLTAGGLCFLKQTPFYFAFMTPVALLLGFNLIIMFFILTIILKCGIKSTPAVNRANLNATSQSVKGIFGLICILSLTWIFGFLYFSFGKVVFQYIFILTTALQGFFIFVFFILLKPNIRGFVLSPFTIRNLIERRQEQQQRILDLQ